ncbi:MAG: caspase family protein [Roseiarcus sp.]
MRAWIAVLLAWLWSATPGAADTRVALVIGNSAYSGVGALSNPTGDAALVADALGSEGFRITLVRDATRTAMLKALQAFSDEADQADWALVYYAGHGIEVGRVNYLLPTDVELRSDRDAQDEAISLNRVLETVENARKLRLVILDACRNNPFTYTMKRSIRIRAVDRGLAPAEPQAGVIVVYAAAAGEVAEDGAGDHSPFAAALARRMQEPGLEVSRLFNVVTADVLDATGHRQRPYQYGSNPTREEFYFKPPAPVVAKLPDPSAFERTWGFLETSEDASVLKAFLDSLPGDSPLRDQVQVRIAQLAKTATQVANPAPEPPKPAPVGPPKPSYDETLEAMIDNAKSADFLATLIAGLPDGPVKDRATARMAELKKTQVASLPPGPPKPAPTASAERRYVLPEGATVVPQLGHANSVWAVVFSPRRAVHRLRKQ